MNDTLLNIKKLTRLALPTDDTYLYRLGIALYGFSSINSFMTEIICHIDKVKDRSKLLDSGASEILKIFRKTAENAKQEYPDIYDIMKKTGDLFEYINEQRTDFIHAYPITNKKNEQILHRRKNSKSKYFEIDNIFLDKFISKLHDISYGLYEIRKIVRQDL